MDRFFDAQAAASFFIFSQEHRMALSVVALLIALLFCLRRWFRDGNQRNIARWSIASVLILCEVSLNIWYVREGVYQAKDTLPLELCSISLYLCVVMLLTRSRLLFQICYYAGIGGALQALLTPVLGYAFPHYRFLEFFTAHGFIILAVLFMIWVEGYRPNFRSIWLTLGFLNLLLIVVWFVNRATGGNYMFVARKPDTASLLDVLGPYPWYLLSLEGVVVLLFLLMYLPFARRRSN
ncbi:MAG: TIGR02206 family membrane protein [Gorillibacterium sp.]|nr:TIGR02206 family membrane protein [Gorillibacterium sp.]